MAIKEDKNIIEITVSSGRTGYKSKREAQMIWGETWKGQTWLVGMNGHKKGGGFEGQLRFHLR